MESRELSLPLTIEEIVDKRNQVLSLFNHGVKSINKALMLSNEIQASGAYLAGWHNINPEEFKKEFDRKLWRYLFQISGTKSLMNADQKAEFEKSMEKSVPEVTVDTVELTLITAKKERKETFVTGLVGVLKGVCTSYKNNKAFLINKKLIFSGLSGWGTHAETMKNRMVDIERMLHVANNEKPPEITCCNWIGAKVGTQAFINLKYLSIKTFKNGNAHMVITCNGTLNKLNDMIAEYYEENTLAD